MDSKGKICILGSANGDIFLKVNRLPQLGETISSSEQTKAPGGKGANQAAACGRLNSDATFLCQVGKDEAGDTVLNAL